jgi:hypothetical protein
MTELVETGTEPKLTDWRGQPIEVGTAVIWRQGSTSSATWKIGRVTEIQKEPYGQGDREWSLCVEWVEESWTYSKLSGKARGVMPYNVTVWPPSPEQFATVTTQRDQLAACLPIEELELDTRSYNVLTASGIHHIGELLRMTEDDITDLRNAGMKTLDNIQDRLRDVCGLALKQRDEP